MRILALAAMILGLAATVSAGTIGDSVEVEVRTDGGRSLSLYPTQGGRNIRKAYAEAVKGDNYGIIIRNRTNRRIGVVVAVDGRNIISGKKSWLANSERMYILGPYESGEYSGWRTGSDRINRFFFTSAGDSYAASFGDKSAMGVIAVAVYPEVRRYEPYLYDSPAETSRGGAAQPAAPSARSKSEAREERAGTGYGREEYSPSTVVAFDPESSPAEKIFLKYEWRSTLCRKGIVRCGRGREPQNRFWEDDGYAPPPGGYYR